MITFSQVGPDFQQNICVSHIFSVYNAVWSEIPVTDFAHFIDFAGQ